MDIDIRKSIKENFKDAKQDEIKASITEAIESSDEITLPGLGTLFEILWKQSDDDQQNYILSTLEQGLKK